MAQDYTSKDYGAWLDGNANKRGTEEWQEVQRAYEESLKFEQRSDLMKRAQSGDKEAAKNVLSDMVSWFAEKGRSMGVRGGGAAIGQVLGQRVAGKPGAVIGGAITGGLASAADQLLSTGEIKQGELVADIGQGANLMRGTAVNAAANAMSEGIRQILDEKTASLQGMSEAALAGAVGAKASQKMTGSKNARDALFKYRDAIFEKLRKDGVVVNPGELGRPDVVGGRALTFLGGNEALYYNASERNQFVWQKLAREELGLDPKGESLAFRPAKRNDIGALVDKGELAEKRAEYYKPYEEIDALSKQAKADLEAFKAGHSGPGFAAAMASPAAKDLLVGASVDLDALKVARQSMNDAYIKARAGDAQAAVDYKSLQQQVGVLEDKLEEAAKVWGDKGLPARLRDARRKIAQSWAVEHATTNAYGLLDPSELVRQRNNGVALTGRLADIADFAEAFSREAEEAVSLGAETLRGVAVPYTARNVLAGNPQGFFAAGMPFVGEGVRSFLLSEGMQNRFAKPSMTPVPENIPAAAVRAGLLVGGRNNTEKRTPPYR